MKNVCVFSPHPDDDLIGCGGSMYKHVKHGNKVTVVYMTSGEAGSVKYKKEELRKIREMEAKNATKILGIDDLIFLRNPDGALEYNEENIRKLVEIIRNKRPQIVYIPHEKDSHKDHIATNRLVVESVRRAGMLSLNLYRGCPWLVETILCYEVWTPLQDFSFVEDITEVIDLKIKALREHKSALAEVKYDEAIQSLNRYRGIMTGKGKYCECFQLLSKGRI
ncbi:MAG: PIG-L family deacetylase [Nitrososphaerota archaeon]|nr:PIG-L family deacetylase [Nitrososphaerota archaeon]